MAWRSKYWSCSEFANRIRGVSKPSAASGPEWNEWETKAKNAHPIRFWIAEEGLDMIQNFLNAPKDALYSATYWFSNAFVERTNVLRTGLPLGAWAELDTRIIHGMMEELCRFVEDEKAWMEYISHSDDYANTVSYFKREWPFRHFTRFNEPTLGLKYLEWESSLIKDDEWFGYSWRTDDQVANERAANPEYGKPTAQADAAMQVIEIYNWWRNIRPLRPDPMDTSGWSAYCDAMRAKHGDSFWAADVTDDAERSSEMVKEMSRIELLYDEEDTNYLIRLIKIRKSLWT